MNNENGVERSATWLERLSRLLLREPKDQAQLVTMLREAEQRHLLNADSLDMIEGVLDVSTRGVADSMVPRSQMVVIQEKATIEQILPIICESTHSRYPIVNENFDEVVGILLVKDVIRYKFSGQEEFNLKSVLRPVMFVPESKRLDALLKEFRIKHMHMALVVDEYGSISGLITIEDILEEIVGDIEDEHDAENAQADIVMQTKNKFVVNAQTLIEEFNDYFHVELDHPEFNTIGGIVMNRFGHLPKIGEVTTLGPLEFKVLDSDGRRINALQVARKKKL